MKGRENMVLFNNIKLSEEQNLFVTKALEGNNILVDACIGSGKTTAIQQLCNVFPSDKKILYLTYNKLLKLDAKSKIHKKNVLVTNYHGFAYMSLLRAGKKVGISDLIQVFNNEIKTVGKYDLLIIDEYQDIEQELSELLEIIKNSNPQMQIIAVGDMEQKIYDKTTLDVSVFIKGFLDDFERLEFTRCFRLSEELASMLGRVWKKKIIGVNNNCIVEDMSIEEVINYLSTQNTEDILCLGARNGKLAFVLNELEERFPDKFNKKTVFASISDREANGATEPKETSAIFTTYDSSKGLERKICVVFDFTESYWGIRINQPQTSYEVMRNIFCVAASRGKEHIIFVKYEEAKLSEKTLSSYVESHCNYKPFDISSMFDFKYKEDVEKCFRKIEVTKKQLPDQSIIAICNKDELIDLSPCIGIYQEAMFFSNYDIDVAIKLHLFFNDNKNYLYDEKVKKSSLDEKILFLTSLETGQARYRTQVQYPFVSQVQREMLLERLSTIFSTEEDAQVECSLSFAIEENGTRIYPIMGYADVVKDDIVYELKYVTELTHEHFLQCACYMIALELEKGILWNTRDNVMYEIQIPNRKDFMDSVINAITKGNVSKYYDAREKYEWI